MATSRFLGGNARYVPNPSVWNTLSRKTVDVPRREKKQVNFLCTGCNQNCITRVPHVRGHVRYCSNACRIKDGALEIRGAARLSSPSNNNSQTDNNVWKLVTDAYQQASKRADERQRQNTKTIKGAHTVSA